MNGLRHDAWAVFQEQREKAPNWKWSFNLAVALHAAVFAGAVFLPDAVETPRYDDVIIVDLLSLPASAPSASAPASVVKRVTAVRRSDPEPIQREQSVQEVVEQTAPDVIPENEPEVEALAVSPPEPEISPEPIALVNPVSLRPLKRKIKLVEDTRLAAVKEREEQEKQAKSAAQNKKRLAEQKKRKKAAEDEKKLTKQKKRKKEAAAKKKLAERKRQKKAADARREKAVATNRKAEEAQRVAEEAQRVAEEAQREAAMARQEYASVSQAASDINTPLASGGAESESGVAGGSGTGHSGGSGAGRANADVIVQQYGATLEDRIRSQWQLPEIITTTSNLKAMVALTVRRDGSIEDMRLEQKSGDAIFDQSVLKALRNAEPMPSFPALIRKSTLDFALNFTPQGLAL